MKCTVKAFGIAREILGGSDVEVDFEGNKVSDLRNHLNSSFPALRGLNSLFIAINHSYAEDATVLRDVDEIAIIPPVSGG